MNKPPKGNKYRLSNTPQLMFQVTATNDTANPMRVKVSEGSFWVNNRDFVEVADGYSPVFEAPTKGAKWVLVCVDALGNIKLINGVVTVKTSPEQPEITKNYLPLAFVFVKSGTTQITQDIIFPCHSFIASGGYPQKHGELTGRNDADSHDIDSITDLREELNSRYTTVEMQNLLGSKADIEGTTESTFILNREHTGVPVEYCGITVNRGSAPNVGLRFNEDTDQWQYTNDGTEWHNISNDNDLYDYASSENVGMVKLSVAAEDATNPVVVGDNDPRLSAINNKLDKNVIADYYNKNEIDTKLDTKADSDAVYSKYDAETVFITRAEYNSGTTAGYTKDQINSFLALKANASGVYNKSEVDALLANIYTKDEADKAIASVATGGLDVYTTKEVDALLKQLSDNVYSKDAVDAKFDTVDVKLTNKANVSDVYTKTEIDNMISSGTGSGTSTVNLSNYYNKSEVDILIADRADVTHGHVATDISQDSTHRFVTDDEITAWNNKQNSLGYTAENTANRGVANGYATLDSTGKIPLSQLPSNISTSGGTGSGGIEFVNTYSSLLAVTSPDSNKRYFVVDASGDSTVNSGWAEYVYDGTKFIKVGEQEGLDAILDWSNVTNKPSVFAPDTSLLTNYLTTTNGYTKTEVDNLLDNKSDVTHNHDSRYALKTDVDKKLNTTDYDKFALGSFKVDETNIADGMALTYNASAGKLVYSTVSSGSSTGSTSTTSTVDYFKLGSYTVTEPTDLANGYALVYNNNKLTYQNIHNQLGTATLDESAIAQGKVLTYDGSKLVYTALPSNLLSIDTTNIADGKVLAYNATTKTLEYVDKGSSSSSSTASGTTYYTYTVTASGGQKCLVRAAKQNAVSYVVSGTSVTITIDKDADVQMLQPMVLKSDHNGTSGSPATVQIEIKYSDGSKVFDFDNYDGIMPQLGFYAMDATRKFNTANMSFSDINNNYVIVVTKVATYDYLFKILF